jgi:hypothetical protein
MPRGTIVNNIFAPRLHKSNAHAKLEEANDSIEYIEKTILFLIAANGSQEDSFMTIATVGDLLTDYANSLFTRQMANSIIQYPEDCKDELEQ